MARSNGNRVIDNAPIISFEADFSVIESIGSRPIVVTRTGNLTVTTVVPYYVMPKTAGVADYTTAASGVLTFAPSDTSKNIANSIIDDILIEGTEQYLFELGADNASWARGKNTCLISIIDNDGVAPASVLTRLTGFEIPYGLLTPAQQAAQTTSTGYAGFAVARSDTTSISYALYQSTTSNGVYSKVADNQGYNAYADLYGNIGFNHANLPFKNEFDLPASLPVNSIGLISDTAGQQEFCLLNTYTTQTVQGDTAKLFTNVKNGLFDSLPIAVADADTASIQLLTSFAVDPTPRAIGTYYYKVVAKDLIGIEQALSSVQAIAVTIAARASLPYPPKAVGFGLVAVQESLIYYPTAQYLSNDLIIGVEPANRGEIVPTGFFNPSGSNEAGVIYKVEVINNNGVVIRTLDVNQLNTEYHYTTYAGGVRGSDGALALTKYRAFALQGALRSKAVEWDVKQDVVEVFVAGVTAAQSGANIIFSVDCTFALSIPYAIDFELSGTVISTNAYGTLSSTGTLMELDTSIQVQPGISIVTLTVPTIAAAGKTLTAKFGNLPLGNFNSTTITVV